MLNLVHYLILICNTIISCYYLNSGYNVQDCHFEEGISGLYKMGVKKIEIVIVDDSPDILDILDLILSDHGYKVKTYLNAELALREIPDQFTPDLFLFDVNLPGISGLDLCRKLKGMEQLEQVPVIFISGLMEDSDKKKGFEAGGEDYITKPFSKADILARIKTHIKLRRSLQELQQLNLNLEARIEERTKELLRAKEEAERANRAKTVFLSNINHEMRTPLNGILGMLRLMKNITMNKDGATYLSLAEYSANHLSVIIREILDYSQLESKSIHFHYKQMDLRSMMEKLYSIQKTIAEEQGLSLRIIHPEESYDFTGDETRLYQIVVNLLSNAIKYSKKGTITIRYRIGKFFRVEVEDQGIGIPKEKMEDIFLPFLQLDASYTKENRGIGLGLAITRNLVKSMDGTISLKSCEKGTCFSVEVPDKNVILPSIS